MAVGHWRRCPDCGVTGLAGGEAKGSAGGDWIGTMDVHVQGFQGVRCDNGQPRKGYRKETLQKNVPQIGNDGVQYEQDLCALRSFALLS